MDWMKIGTALLIVAMMIYIWPSAKHMMTNSPKAERGDWQAVALPLLAVVGFVILLIALV